MGKVILRIHDHQWCYRTVLRGTEPALKDSSVHLCHPANEALAGLHFYDRLLRSFFGGLISLIHCTYVQYGSANHAFSKKSARILHQVGTYYLSEYFVKFLLCAWFYTLFDFIHMKEAPQIIIEARRNARDNLLPPKSVDNEISVSVL